MKSALAGRLLCYHTGCFGRERTVRWILIALSLLHAACALASERPDFGDRTLIDQRLCEGCHRATSEYFAHTAHARIFTHDPRTDLERQGCQACHGPGSEHLANPTVSGSIVGFAKRSATPIAEQNAMCQTCHDGGEHLHWGGSAHESADLACSDCHNPMAQFSSEGLLAAETVNSTCFGCHSEQRVEFDQRAHMPLAEGKVSCVDCHAPHGSVSDPLLLADTLNETCFSCHAEKRGPFLWEHAPVTDDCSLCHSPHGSNHEKLLVTARPLLCQQCHNAIGHVSELISRDNLAGSASPDARAIGRSCNNCHVQIHGSNHPAGSRFQR